MKRSYYQSSVEDFCAKTSDEVLGEIVSNNAFALEQMQRDAWIYQINLLRTVLASLAGGGIAFEYTIPRVGARIDNVLIYNGVIYIIEFKVGEHTYPKHAAQQVLDYALDLKYFHKASQARKVVPILLCTHAEDINPTIDYDEDGIYHVIRTSTRMIRPIIEYLASCLIDRPITIDEWINSPYMPTPTIIEAAQALYRGHDVKEISRSDSESYNLSLTSDIINKIIDYSKAHSKKSICFITGVPGAGKTLAGLNIANARHNFEDEEHAVFLSGNGPLVDVLREALARDEASRSNGRIRVGISRKKANAFIQNIHHFRDEALTSDAPPNERVAIFDESQRAWTMEQTASFMIKRGHIHWEMSEPEFLISIMDRHKDWAVIVCLVGGGQEINTGEAGLPAWFDALKKKFSHWDVYTSNRITDQEYTRGLPIAELFGKLSITAFDNLHLAVSLRSFRSEHVSEFVKALLDVDRVKALSVIKSLNEAYPILITRNLLTAKKWIQSKARASERFGIIASSGAKRLKTQGIWVQNEIEAKEWFLNPADDVRSSNFLENTATEFDIQGLEIDWAIVAWDANYRFIDNHFECFNFIGTRWNSIRLADDRLYLKNAYRVLLTRARQGFIIFIPFGDEVDETRKPEFYDGTYRYLKSIGIPEI